MPIRINGLTHRNKHFAELSDVIAVTSGSDKPHYIEELTGRSGELGFKDWQGHWQKAVGTLGSGTPDKYYSLVVVPINDRITFGGTAKIGNPTTPSTPVFALSSALDIDWTLPVHDQQQSIQVGKHTGADGEATVLTDSDLSLADDVLNGYTIYNLTDGSSGLITDTTANTIVCSGGISGGTGNVWDEGDEYQVRTTECNKRYIYGSRGDTAADAWAGPFYFIDVIDDNTTTAYTQTLWAATTGLLDDERYAPPSGAFCMSAYNRMWVAGGIQENRGQVTLNMTDANEDYDVADGTIDVSVVTTDFDSVAVPSTSGQVMRYTRNTGLWDSDVVFIGAYVTVNANGGGSPINAVNELTDARVLYVATDETYFDVLHPTGVAEAGVHGDISFKLNYLTGNTSGANQTYFDEGFIGSKISLTGDNRSYIVAWVDPITQEMGLTSLYEGALAGTSVAYNLRNDTKVSYSITFDPGVHPTSNYVDVDDYVVGLGHIGRSVIVFGESSITRFSADEPAQGLSSILSSKGCTAPYSIVETSKGILFWDGEGVSLTDGTHVRSLTENRVDDLMVGANRDQEYNYRAVYDADEETYTLFFAHGSEVTNDHSILIRLSSGDVYPMKRKDVNAVWRERDSDGIWRTHHGTSARHTNSTNSYVWEHRDDVGHDGVPGTDGIDDFMGEVTSVADIGTNTVEVMASRLGFKIGTSTTDPYLGEGLPAVFRAPNASSELYPVIKVIGEAALAREGDALYRGSGVTDDGTTLFIGEDNLDVTGKAAADNPSYVENEHAGRRIYNVTTGAEGVIYSHDLCTFTCMSGEGTHTDTSVSTTVLTDSSASKWGWVVNSLEDKVVRNLSDGSEGTITSNTATTITVGSLAGGATNRWNYGDEWVVWGLFRASSLTVEEGPFQNSLTSGIYSVQDPGSPGWTTDEWVGYYIQDDVTKDVYEILSNTTDTLTADSTPPATWSVNNRNYNIVSGSRLTWDGGSASAVGDEYQIGKRYDATLADDYDVSDISVGDKFFYGIIPVSFGPKWTDFGSPHLKHLMKRLMVDTEPSTGNWIVVEHMKDSNPAPVEIREGWVDNVETKMTAPMVEGKCYTYGFRITCYGRNRLNIQNITEEFTSLQ